MGSAITGMRNSTEIISNFKTFFANLLGAVYDDDGEYFVAEFKPIPGYLIAFRCASNMHQNNTWLRLCTDWNPTTNTPTNPTPLPYLSSQAAQKVSIFKSQYEDVIGLFSLYNSGSTNNIRLDIIAKITNNEYVYICVQNLSNSPPTQIVKVASGYPTLSLISLNPNNTIISEDGYFYFAPIRVVSSNSVIGSFNSLFMLTKISPINTDVLVTGSNVVIPTYQSSASIPNISPAYLLVV